ncbi:MAG: CDP-alcohol phosphatidyltransferase family protein [Oscillospiraceae bacterium]|jgi:CDP-diacylglycerol--glycerol-3-phosphate 3-phosphatidyltransferase|nr:CDP-alcohol phosphatidyltransferase family protein [Oscillospiraceae bacterium]
MKHIPNILSLSRVPLSAVLILLAILSNLRDRPASLRLAFMIVYLITGLTDALDGFLARRFHWASARGAKADGFSDVVFLLSMLAVVFVVLRVHFNKWVVGCVVAIAIVRATNLIFTKIKFKQWGLMHSSFIRYATIPIYAVAPICVWTSNAKGWVGWLVFALLVAVLLSVMEETWILALLKDYDMNTKSVYHAFKRRRESNA